MGLGWGDFELQMISGGQFRMDGGCMFGVVPKALWQKKITPDENNRITMATSCLLIRKAGKLILVDTGYGGKHPPKEVRNFSLEAGNPIVQNLAAAGVRPEEIDCVVLTHLHFDHAGGCTHLGEDGQLSVTFPRARHIVQRKEWEDAAGRTPELRGAYYEEDFLPLQQAGLLELVDGDAQVLPGIELRLTGGHTRGHQIVLLGEGDARAIYLADLCPTSTHLPTFWTMGYDLYLRDVRIAKDKWIGQAADKEWLVLFEHDPRVRGAYIARDPKDEMVIRQIVEL